MDLLNGRADMTARLMLYGSPHSQFTYKVGLMLRLAREDCPRCAWHSSNAASIRLVEQLVTS